MEEFINSELNKEYPSGCGGCLWSGITFAAIIGVVCLLLFML